MLVKIHIHAQIYPPPSPAIHVYKGHFSDSLGPCLYVTGLISHKMHTAWIIMGCKRVPHSKILKILDGSMRIPAVCLLSVGPSLQFLLLFWGLNWRRCVLLLNLEDSLFAWLGQCRVLLLHGFQIPDCRYILREICDQSILGQNI